MLYVIASSRTGYEYLPERLEIITQQKFILINKVQDLTVERLKAIKPKYIFFPHWSYIIPSDIYENFECIVFHMTDVPFGRGGSPLQNLISRGIYETKISAIRCIGEVDAGPVYMKKPFYLYGSAEEIYIRSAKTVQEMIINIVSDNPSPVNQEGEVVNFERRRPEEGNIDGLKEIEKIYDYIRMLDADGYPKAFLETDNLKLEFQRASLKPGYIIADVKITLKES